jgi:hypothetical protein
MAKRAAKIAAAGKNGASHFRRKIKKRQLLQSFKKHNNKIS